MTFRLAYSLPVQGPDGTVYPSIHAAALATGRTYPTMRGTVRARAGGWRFADLTVHDAITAGPAPEPRRRKATADTTTKPAA